MSWLSNSGFGKILGSLFTNTVQNPDFQRSAFDFIIGIGNKLLEHKNDPKAIQTIAQGLVQHADVAVGTIVKGTPVEAHVDPEVIQAVEKAQA